MLVLRTLLLDNAALQPLWTRGPNYGTLLAQIKQDYDLKDVLEYYC